MSPTPASAPDGVTSALREKEKRFRLHAKRKWARLKDAHSEPCCSSSTSGARGGRRSRTSPGLIGRRT